MALSPHLAHPYRAREMAKGMAKSDRKDAIFLGKLFLAGGVFPESYLAPPEVRRKRSLWRQRLLLVRMRTALKNGVHGQMFRLGLVTDEEASDLFGLQGRRFLKRLELDDHERWLLDRKLSALDAVQRQVGVMDRALKKDLREDPRATVLMSLPGVAELTAYTLLAEMGEVERFPNGRALAAYAGLLPLDRESADKDFGKHTNRHCNRHLRWAALEAVSGAVVKSPRMRSLHARVKAKNPYRVGKARVAVSREMLELAHLLLTHGKTYQEHPPARPGSLGRGRRSDASHPNRASQMPLCTRPA